MHRHLRGVKTKPGSSSSVTVTELGPPAVTESGRLPNATVEVSPSLSASSLVDIVAVPLVDPAAIVMARQRTVVAGFDRQRERDRQGQVVAAVPTVGAVDDALPDAARGG